MSLHLSRFKQKSFWSWEGIDDESYNSRVDSQFIVYMLFLKLLYSTHLEAFLSCVFFGRKAREYDLIKL